MKTGIELIAEERDRQISVEGFTAERDKDYTDNELAWAAATYALPSNANTPKFKRVHLWPWAKVWWKPSPDERVKELVKAGALIAAEIDRLQAIPKQEPIGKADDNGYDNTCSSCGSPYHLCIC
jgi:hypothetical protein